MACPANPNHNIRESAPDLRRASPRQCPPQGLPTAPLPQPLTAKTRICDRAAARKLSLTRGGTPFDGSPVWRDRIRTSAAWRRRVAQTGTSRMELDARRLELALAAGSSGRPSRLAPPAPGDGDLRLHVRH